MQQQKIKIINASQAYRIKKYTKVKRRILNCNADIYFKNGCFRRNSLKNDCVYFTSGWPVEAKICSDVEFILRPTASRPVHLGIGLPFGAFDQILSLSFL
jgi:hypothetical protein